MRPIKSLALATAAASLLCLSAPRVDGQRVTGFESGDTAPTPIGDAGSRGAYQGVAPFELANQYLITTINSVGGDVGETSQSGINAVGSAALNAFVGTSVGAFEGSAFTLTILITPLSNIVSFNYDFLTNEGRTDHPDLAFAVLTNSGGTVVGGLRTIATPASISAINPLLLSGSPFIFHTGYQEFSFTVATPGTYTLTIGVADRQTSDIPSALLVDNIRIIPEPSTVALAFAGVGLLVGLQRIRTRLR